MRYPAAALLALAALIAAMPVCAQLKPKAPVVVCPRVQQAPVLDGQLEPAEWAAAGCLSDFMVLGASALPRLPSRVFVMHTENALYLGAQLYDDAPGQMVANVTERDGRVYEDDCIEVYIDTEAGRTDYAQLVVNSLGTRFDAYNRDAADNFEWSVFSAVNNDGWTVEIELPFDQGIPPLEGESWNLGVCRNAARAGELSTWGRHERGFHEPDAFGEMAFVSPLLTARVDDMGDRLWGENLAIATIENLADRPVDAKLHVVVMGGDRRSHYAGVIKKTLPARGREQVYIPYRVRRCGPCWIALSLTDDRGKTAWRTAALPIDLPDLSDALDEAGHHVAEAWKSWAFLAPSETRDELREKITNLQTQWEYLDSQTPSLVQTADPRLQAMAVEAQRLREQASEMREQLRSMAELAAR